MHERIFVSGEADISDFACLFSSRYRFERTVLSEEAIRIIQADVLVILDQVDVVCLEAL